MNNKNPCPKCKSLDTVECQGDYDIIDSEIGTVSVTCFCHGCGTYFDGDYNG